MAISNFGSLKGALTTYLRHGNWAGQYPDAVDIFEKVANRRLRVLPMEASTNLTTSDGECAVPADYLLWRTVLWNGEQPELDYVHPAYLSSAAISSRPGAFTIEGPTFRARPIDDTADIFEFHYYQKIPTIVGTQDSDLATNWLITNHPDLYLEGSLTELFALQRNGELAILHKQRRDELFTELIQLSALTTGATSSRVRETAEYF
jgi:hypothetical protein